MSDISTLAGIIQGEASQPADQFGVASVIANRAAINHGGYGTSAIAQATAPNQFSGYNPNPSPYATTLATALVNGNLSSYGDTGNALFYNAPGYAYAPSGIVTNTYSGSSNIYSDVYNQQPTPAFQLPQANGNTLPAYADSPLHTPDIGAQSESGSSLDSITGATESDLFGTTGSGGIGSDAVAGGSAATDNSPFPSSPLDTPTPESFSGGQVGVNNPSDQIQFNKPVGSPLWISNAADIGQQGSQDVSKAVTGLNQGVQTAEAKGAATATSLTQSWFGAFTDILARGGFIVVGLVILAGAFLFYYMEGKSPVAEIRRAAA